MTERSLALELAYLTPAEAEARIGQDAEALTRDWRFWARPDQILPAEGWNVSYLRGGRGSGKGFTGSNNFAELLIRYGEGEWACVGPTFADARDTMIESDESGLVKALGGRCAPTGALIEKGPHIDQWNRSNGQLALMNGAVVYTDGANDGALRIQGKNLKGCWADEVGLWKQWETAWDESIGFAVRIDPARIIATGTPKRNQPARVLVKRLVADPKVLNRVLRTLANAAFLEPTRLEDLLLKYQGTTLGRQELEGEILEIGGGFFKRPWFTGNEDPAANTGRFVLNAIPPGQDRRTRMWDLAATEATDENRNPDWTAGGRVSYNPGNRLWMIEDMARFRLSPGARDARIAAIAQRDPFQQVWVECEPGASGKSVVEYLDRLLGEHGKLMKGYRPTGAKGIRAEVLATVAERGKDRDDPTAGPGVAMLQGDYIPALLDELEEFDPEDQDAYDHDDQVDTISAAMSVLSTAPPAAGSSPAARKLPTSSVATSPGSRRLGSRR